MKHVSIAIALIAIITLTAGCSPDTSEENPQQIIKEEETSANGEVSDGSYNSFDDLDGETEETSNTNKDIEEDGLLPFTSDECSFKGIEFFTESKEVKKVFGEPDKSSESYDEVYDRNYLVYYYSFGRAIFDEGADDGFYLTGIIIDKEEASGPRDIQIGDNVTSVFDKFPDNRDSNEIESHILYGEDYDTPENGYIEYGEDGEIERILYLYGHGGYGTYGLVLYIDDDKVSEIHLVVETY